MMPRVIEFNEQKIISKALQVFWKKGYHATSMKDLVEATGLNPGSIYNTFGNKHDLFLACLKDYLNPIYTYDLKQKEAQKNPLELLREFYMEVATNSVLSQDSCLSVKSSFELATTDDETHQLLKNSMDKLFEIFEQMVINAQKAGSISDKQDTFLLAQLIVATLPGLGQNFILYKDKNRIAKIIDDLLDLITK
ncbi:TetR/AcrR family transcriptional regulator [Olivibacter sp. CPCC 100613]|uniref:TetR/AcrR family transcriptional regulator n=1 Tax=Olivibacter sp. CPCC 100613 TaxID=3079931 RepID=UPI002FF78397